MDVVHVLRKLVAAGKPGGVVLDLQVIRPDPRVEVDGRVVGELDGAWLFARADAATAAVDALVAAGRLVEQDVLDHDVCTHYTSGAEFLADRREGKRPPRGDLAARLEDVEGVCLVRERCRLRRLAVR